MIDIRYLLTTLLELLGLGAVVVGAYLFDPRAALIVGGLVAVLIGFVAGAPAAPKRRPEQ